ncbi:MAG TPA: ABC transporter permease subunit [Candidatus Hydrogenedentes bacterium]|nr:ABC transporter permease subunit [Candidatus Hydrogenedentota bacterium]
MTKLLFRRLMEGIPVLWAIITITFFLIRFAPGSPFDRDKEVSPEIKKRIEAHYNLDAPVGEQYLDYMGNLVRGDLGPSFKNVTYSVNELIGLSFPVSLELGFYALCVALTIGLTAGTLASLKPNTIQDYIPMSLSMVGICIPNFVLGPVLLLVFGLNLGWFPVSGWDEPMDKVLPSLTLGAMYAAYIARLTRGGMLEILTNDFIRTARAKGLSETRVVFRHALPGGLTPVVTFLGPATAGLMSGSFVVETIFQIPGLGKFFVEAAFNRDYTMILGTVLFYATLILILNIVSDLILVWLDPRLRDA